MHGLKEKTIFMFRISSMREREPDVSQETVNKNNSQRFIRTKEALLPLDNETRRKNI
jgi:hypothetical protein